MLAISKTDLLDDELQEAIAQDLPDIPHVFISAVTNLGLTTLKDMLWKELNSKDDILILPKEEMVEKDSLIHRNLDIKTVVFEDDDSEVPADDSDDDEFEVDDEDYSYLDE